jgi:hypothetical protein
MHHAASGFLVASGISVLATLSFTSGIGMIEAANSLYDTRPRTMTVLELSYSDGHFRQHIGVTNGPIRAAWAARIARGERTLCTGGGESTYTGLPLVFTPNEWTGDTCPEIQPGDVATGTWEWRTREGNIDSISSSLVLMKPNQLPLP